LQRNGLTGLEFVHALRALHRRLTFSASADSSAAGLIITAKPEATSGSRQVRLCPEEYPLLRQYGHYRIIRRVSDKTQAV
jgi:hypothetical protein